MVAVELENVFKERGEWTASGRKASGATQWKSRPGTGGRTGFLEKVRVPPGKEQPYLDMPVEAGAGAGAGSLAQPPRPMAIAAMAMRAMYFIV